MAHHSPYVNRNIQIGLVSGNGNRFESDLNMDAQDILEYHLHPKVNFELLNDFRLTELG